MTEVLTRLVSLVRRHDADLGEAALLCAKAADPDLDVEVELLRLDALADRLRSSWPQRVGTPRPVADDAPASARALATYLGDELGFTAATDPSPDAAHLHRVLTTRRGLPLSLAIVYAAIGRRVGIATSLIAMPGQVLTGIAAGDRPIVLDPSDGGRLLDDDTLRVRVGQATAGQLAFRRSMLRASPAVNVVRRLLNDVIRAELATDGPRGALWAIEYKLALPNRLPIDHRQHGELLQARGRFDEAAAAFERYLELSGADAPQREEVRRLAIEARARLN